VLIQIKLLNHAYFLLLTFEHFPVFLTTVYSEVHFIYNIRVVIVENEVNGTFIACALIFSNGKSD
jgi:hypothetical protein